MLRNIELNIVFYRLFSDKIVFNTIIFIFSLTVPITNIITVKYLDISFS